MIAHPRIPASVVVVDDSAFMRLSLKRMIESDPALHVTGTAADGQQALRQIQTLHPDVVTLDVEMPGWSGLETLDHIARECPCPVIMVSSHTPQGAHTTLEALGMGAFDCVPKQVSQTDADVTRFKCDLIAKIKAAAGNTRLPIPATRISSSANYLPLRTLAAPRVVAIGCSTGGPRALQTILPCLPADFPVPVVIVQHMPVGFTGPFAERLNRMCSVTVREARDGDALRRSTILIAPAGLQMEVVPGGNGSVVQLSSAEPKSLHAPSVDVMMESVAATYGRLCLGVILTGMGQDGLQGLTAIAQQGGVTLGQDEASCAVYGMPRSCAEAGVVQRTASLTTIPELLIQAVSGQRWQ